MAILRSSDGKFYDVADDQLQDKLIPADQVKEKLDQVGVPTPSGPTSGGPAPMSVPGNGQVVIQIFTSPADAGGEPGPAPEGAEGEGDVEAHGWCWRRNCWRNYWRRNCWRNHCY